MKHLILAALIAAPLTAMAAASDPDSSFYKALAEGGVAEVADGKLAETRAADPKIKDFAAMMVKDHSAANQELKALATSRA
jgi:putative membrane protein